MNFKIHYWLFVKFEIR